MKNLFRKFSKWLLLGAVLIGLIAGASFLWKTGFFEAIGSAESLQLYVQQFSPYCHLCFFFLQLMCVIFAPLPSNVTAMTGGILFGFWQGAFLTLSAVLIGSMTVFSLTRLLGQNFVQRFVSKSVSEKYTELVRSKTTSFLILAFLFPFFPDDLLCFLAGLTSISPLRFFLIVLLTRPWGLLFASALGGSALSLPLWAIALLGFAGLALFFLGLKYGDRLEQAVLQKFSRKK